LAGISIWFIVFVPATKTFFERHELSENLCNDLIEGMGNIAMTAVIDSNRNIIFANDNFLKSTGFSNTDLVGNSISILRSTFHSPEFYDQIWKRANEGKTWAGEIRNKKKDGEPIWTKTFFMPINNAEKHFILFQFDVTEEKLLQEAITNEQLKNIHIDRLALLGEMAGGISHEINNPLTAISGSLTMLEQYVAKGIFDDKEKNEKAFSRIPKAQQHVFRITKIVSALKEFSRNGENSSQMANVNLQHIIDVIHDLNHEKLKDKGITFISNVRDMSFKCNIAQIEEVIAALVSNSVDAIESLENKWIRIDSNLNGDFLEINVTDSGAGIPEAISYKIMQPFFTTKDIGKGTGLGLSIAKIIVENHGGKLFIDFNSINTRFVIRLPLNENPLLDLLDAEQAIEAHLAWRQKLIAILNKDAELHSVDIIDADDKCELGRWIKKVETAFAANRIFNDMCNAHIELHKCVAQIVMQISQGSASKSDLLVGSGSEFDNLSNKVVSCLKKLKPSET
jgi:PAS domain S-box-containing protein